MRTLETFVGKQAANYSTLPTIDVEIIPEDERDFHCAICGGDLRADPRRGLPRWLHVDEPECEGHESLDGAHMGETVFCDGTCVRHHITPRATCAYCGADEATTFRQHAWHDAIECGRCGGITGWAIGD